MSALLLRPFAYLTIKHEGSRLPVINWGLPAAISLAALAAIGLMAPSLNAFHQGGLVDRVLSFVQSMPGFYLAALAAVATFGREGMDRLMPGTPPRAMLSYNGQLTDLPLTRRRFLTMMFAYLTALSIVLTISAILAITLVDPVAKMVGTEWRALLRAGGLFVFLMMFAQMVVITLWGLYYLGEKIHSAET